MDGHRQTYRISIDVGCKLCCFVAYELLRKISSLNLELNLTGPFHTSEKIGSLVHCAPCGKKPVVLENDDTASRSQSLYNSLPFIIANDNAAEVVIYSLCAIEVARVLVDNVKRSTKSRPGLSIGRMHMTGGMDVGTGTVDRAMDDKTGRVDGNLVAPNDLALFIDMNHIAGLQHAKVNAHTINIAWLISNKDIARLSLMM